MLRVTPPRRISERIHEQSVDVPGQGTPQTRTSKRTQEQTVIPGLQSIPQKRISKRIVEQNVDDSEPQVVPQERIEGHIEGTSSSAAVPLDTAEWLGEKVFHTFSLGKKSVTSAPQSSANKLSHSSSWTPTPYELSPEEEARMLRLLGPNWRERARRGEFG